MNKTVAIACDHAGFPLKEAIRKYLEEKGIEMVDYGCYTAEKSVDYPVYAHLVAESIQKKTHDLGLLICGTGIGMSMAANKHAGIRAAVCSDAFSAEMTRRHNDANILCLGARVVTPEQGCALAELFLTTPYEGGRHQRRVDMVTELDKKIGN